MYLRFLAWGIYIYVDLCISMTIGCLPVIRNINVDFWHIQFLSMKVLNIDIETGRLVRR